MEDIIHFESNGGISPGYAYKSDKELINSASERTIQSIKLTH